MVDAYDASSCHRSLKLKRARELFNVLKAKFSAYCGRPQKDGEDILLILMICNHLREWIAPKYHPNNGGTWPPAKTPAHIFSKSVFEHPKFSTIRNLCNGTKHASKTTGTEINYEPNMFAWANLLSVKNLLKGVPTAHIVDGQPIEDIVTPVIAKYEEWFADPKH